MGVSVLFQNKLGKLDTVELDATLQETHSGDVAVTEHPVEKGADVTDHVRIKPETLVLDCMLTNTPVGSTFAIPANLLPNPERAQEGYRKILDLKDAGEPISVVTGLRDYDDMVIKSIVVNRDKDTGNAVMMKVALQQITYAETKVGTAPPAPAKKSGAPKRKLGKKPAAPANDTQRQSLGFKGFTGLKNLISGVH